MPATILVIDDSPDSLEILSTALIGQGVEILTALDPEVGMEMVRERHPQIVITDLMMPKLTGMEVLEQIMAYDPTIEVILMTAHYSTESAVEAIKKGASDYLNKPISLAAVRERVRALLDRMQRRAKVQQLESELSERCQLEGIIGNSPQIWELFSKIERVAPHFRSVLVTGPTGTGKELVARALHRLSPARQKNLVVLNCSAVVESLFESELFGHVKGSFTGATNDKMGLFELAHEGAIFLDEIGDMPLATQAKLLRALQNQEVHRVGSLTPRRVNVRVIAATNHDLRADVQEKKFREDLYYRLSMVEIRTPSLAERTGDVLLLQQHFLRKFATMYGKNVQGIARRAQFALQRHDWPGNVRELENVIGHACMMAMSETIDVEDFPLYMLQPHETGMAAAADTQHRLPHTPPAASEGLDGQEKRLLMEALEQTNGNQTLAAKMLSITRDRLRYRLKKYGISGSHLESAAPRES